MRSGSDKDIESSVPRSVSPPSHLSGSPLWNSYEQIKNSPPKSSMVSCFESSPNFSHHVKQSSKSQFQEQDSSSTTLSTCQTHYATIGNTTRNNTTNPENLGSMNGIDGTHAIRADHQKGGSYFQSGNSDYVFGQVQFDYNHQMGCIPSYQWAESWVGALVAAYGPNALVYPQMLGINQSRVPIPLDCAESIPIYVNAKQFRAILRRRQTRAKLEAQKKVFKTRKPYLHESRHRHALNRERGPGGRFLNKKDTNNNQSNAAAAASGNTLQQYSNSNSGSWEETSSTPSSLSDVTSIFNGKHIFHLEHPQNQQQQQMQKHDDEDDDQTYVKTGKNRVFVTG